MGIKGLFPIIKDHAPDAVKESDIKAHFGRKVAIVRCLPPFRFRCVLLLIPTAFPM